MFFPLTVLSKEIDIRMLNEYWIWHKNSSGILKGYPHPWLDHCGGFALFVFRMQTRRVVFSCFQLFQLFSAVSQMFSVCTLAQSAAALTFAPRVHINSNPPPASHLLFTINNLDSLGAKLFWKYDHCGLITGINCRARTQIV